MYADDHQDLYPAYEEWATLGGTTGAMTLAGGRVPGARRPLNVYVPGVEAWRCPSDKGDSLWKNMFTAEFKGAFPTGRQSSCFEAYGNSYKWNYTGPKPDPNFKWW